MRAVRMVLVLAVVVLMACPLLAQDRKKKGEGKRGGPGGDPMAMMLRDLNLTDEQKAKVQEVRKEFGPKLAEIQKKRDGVLTDEQKKARDEAVKSARDAGKSPREVFAAGREAVKLTDEQQAKMAEIQKEAGALEKERMEKIKEILTPEQNEKLEKQMAEAKKRFEGKKGGEGKKREKKKAEN